MLGVVLATAMAASQRTDVTRELTEFERRLAATWKAGDCDAWGAMLAPDWSVIHLAGQVITKAGALTMCRAPRPAIETHTVDQLTVRSFGNAAVVTGRTTVVTGGENPQTIRLRFTDVYIRTAGRWQVVASHATKLEP